MRNHDRISPRRRRHRATTAVRATAVLAATTLLLAGCASTSGRSDQDHGSRSADPGIEIERPAAPAGELPPDLQARLESAVESTMADYSVPGAVAGVWIPGRGSWTTATGFADVESGTPATTSMAWPLRSVTKSYTVTLLLQLVDEGTVHLDDTIDEYLSGVTDGDRITLRELANMTSGVADYTNERFLEAYSEDPERVFTLDDLNGFVLGEPAQFEPGAEAVYTNANTNLLGAVIEKATHQDFAEVLDERILQPLGQTGTRYLTTDAEWPGPHPAGYIVQDGVPAAQDQNPSIFGPAGSLVSTLDDARVWADALGEGSFLSEGMQRLRQEGTPLAKGPPYDQYALGIGETDGWWGHNGEGLGFTAAVFHDPDSGASIAVFMNESNVPDVHPADATFRALEKILATEDAK